MTTSASPRRSLVSTVALTAVFCAASSSLFAQNAEDRRRRGEDTGGDRRNLSPQDMQDRVLSSLRERFEVTDDEEWKVISARLNKLMELRRNAPGGGGAFMFAGRGPGGPGGGGDRGGGDANRGRGGAPGGRGGGSPETTALASALRDKLPDAEIKSRLDRVRELRKENEAKMTKAQEELRAVLSVRQEAIAVMFGLLP